jgi:Domain of unknown function (DUF1963)
MAESIVITLRSPFFPMDSFETIDMKRLLGEPKAVQPILPCILFKSERALNRSERSRGCRLGGDALVPAGFEWPRGTEGPLSLVGQLDFEQLAVIHKGAIPSLPTQGVLSFFYDNTEQPWGFLPNDKSGWKFVYVADPDQAEIVAPEESVAIPEHTLTGVLAESQIDEDSKPVHQLGGHAAWIQGDARSTAQMGSHGLQLDKEVLKDAEKRQVDLLSIGRGTWDWILLWQINSDDSAGLMWGDVGALYVLIRRADLEALAFDRAWVILQCY